MNEIVSRLFTFGLLTEMCLAYRKTHAVVFYGLFV
jgi:hypothetical protein